MSLANDQDHKVEKKSNPVRFVHFLKKDQPGWIYPGTVNQQLHFRNWLRGIHHKCAEALFGNYCDEFGYKTSRRKKSDNLFESLITDMLRTKPHPYAVLKIAGA